MKILLAILGALLVLGLWCGLGMWLGITGANIRNQREQQAIHEYDYDKFFKENKAMLQDYKESNAIEKEEIWRRWREK